MREELLEGFLFVSSGWYFMVEGNDVNGRAVCWYSGMGLGW